MAVMSTIIESGSTIFDHVGIYRVDNIEFDCHIYIYNYNIYICMYICMYIYIHMCVLYIIITYGIHVYT